MPGSQAGCIPCGEPQPNCIYVHRATSCSTKSLITFIPWVIIASKQQTSTWHSAIPRCRLRGRSAFCVPADRMLSMFPSAWKAGQCRQTTTHQPAKTWGHNHSGRANHILAASCTTQPFTPGVNFCTLPAISSKTKPKDSPYLSATWFNLLWATCCLCGEPPQK